MSGTFCSNCGAQRSPGAAFCAGCGAALATPAATQPAVPAAVPQYAPPPVPQAAPTAQQTQQFPQQPQPAAVPWGAAAGAPTAARQSGRSVVDALLNGDWGGAAKTAGIAVGAMLAVSLLGVLLVTEGGVGFRETLALILAGASLAVGGDAFAEADVSFAAGSVSLGVLPLTVTLVGVGLLGWLFGKQLRSSPGRPTTEALLQGLRTALVFTAFFLPISLLTRYDSESSGMFNLSGQLGVGVASTLFGALLFAVAALGITWLFARTSTLPGRFGALLDIARVPLIGAVAVFAVGLLAVVAGLIYGLVEGDEPMVQIGAVVLAAGNGALLSVLLSAGVPLNVDGAVRSELADELPAAGAGVDLFTFTDASGWFWLAPVALLATVVLVAAALAVRQNTIEDARREGLRFAGGLAVVAFVATLLLRVAIDGNAGVTGYGDGDVESSLMFNPLFAAVVLGIWGIVAGLIAPAVAAKLPTGFVVGVRSRFGAAAQPTAQPATPPVAPPVV